MTRIFARVFIVLVFLAPAKAQDVPLVADLSSHLVAITTGFTGTDVLLFGATDGPGDIAVVVRGPGADTVVRRKERLGPIWVNGTAMTFGSAPSYYRVASNRPLEEIASDLLLSRFQIGLNNIRLVDTQGEADPALARSSRILLSALSWQMSSLTKDSGP